MSGWDQKYDLETWAKAIQDDAKSLQQANKTARYIYLAGFIFCLAFGIIFDFVLCFIIAAFFFMLLLFNERMIWKLRKAGIK